MQPSLQPRHPAPGGHTGAHWKPQLKVLGDTCLVGEEKAGYGKVLHVPCLQGDETWLHTHGSGPNPTGRWRTRGSGSPTHCWGRHGGAAAGGQASWAVSHKVNVLLLTTQQPCSSGLTQRSWKLTLPEKSARGCLQRPHSQVPNLEAAQVPLSRWWVNKLGPSRQRDITQG